MTIRKTDRRSLITKSMIKDALLELLQNTPYEKITVTALCKQSKIFECSSHVALLSAAVKSSSSIYKSISRCCFVLSLDNRHTISAFVLQSHRFSPISSRNFRCHVMVALLFLIECHIGQQSSRERALAGHAKRDFCPRQLIARMAEIPFLFMNAPPSH